MNNMNDGFDKVINSLFESFEKEGDEKGRLVLNTLKEHMDIPDFDRENIEEFNIFINNNLKKVLSVLIKDIYKESELNRNIISKLQFIYLQYDFLDKNIRKLINQKDGFTCCADKTYFIIKMYKKYLITNTIPEFDEEKDKNSYSIPKFGSYKEWINFCNGLYELYNGNPTNYLLAYNTLLTAEKRVYKHKLHKWFIEYTTGECFNFKQTYDENDNIDIKEYTEGDYYILLKMHIPKDKLNEYKESKTYRMCYLVPKIDIKRIYKETKEIMV